MFFSRLYMTFACRGGGGYSQALADAIERARQAGILFIAAAGNDALNNDVTASYPSGYPHDNVIAVASITSTGALSSFSNYGAIT
jgi:subtilisin family serine protease